MRHTDEERKRERETKREYYKQETVNRTRRVRMRGRRTNNTGEEWTETTKKKKTNAIDFQQ